MSSSSTSSFAFRHSFAMSRQRAQRLRSSCASLRFMSLMLVPSQAVSIHLNADTGKQARPDCISIPRLHAATCPRSGWHSRNTCDQPQLVSLTSVGPSNLTPAHFRNSPYRFWTDILLILSAIGQVISSLITVMVCLVVFSLYSPRH